MMLKSERQVSSIVAPGSSRRKTTPNYPAFATNLLRNCGRRVTLFSASSDAVYNRPNQGSRYNGNRYNARDKHGRPLFAHSLHALFRSLHRFIEAPGIVQLVFELRERAVQLLACDRGVCDALCL